MPLASSSKATFVGAAHGTCLMLAELGLGGRGYDPGYWSGVARLLELPSATCDTMLVEGGDLDGMDFTVRDASIEAASSGELCTGGRSIPTLLLDGAESPIPVRSQLHLACAAMLRAVHEAMGPFPAIQLDAGAGARVLEGVAAEADASHDGSSDCAGAGSVPEDPTGWAWDVISAAASSACEPLVAGFQSVVPWQLRRLCQPRML